MLRIRLATSLCALLVAGVLATTPASAQTPDADVDLTETSTGGRLIVVPRAVLPGAGFIALHDSTLVTDEDPFGSVIGISAKLIAGTHANITVELGPVPGNSKAFTGAFDTIIAMPHKDSNGNGVYDFITSQGADDGPFTGGAHATQTFAGNIVIAAANVTRGSFTVVQDQFTDGTTFKVAFADLSEAGFVALHDTTLVSAQDPFGSVVGVSTKLNAGLHRDVTVQFGKNAPGATKTGKLTESQAIVAMPHKDSNGNGVYDFITSQGAQDGPFAGAAQTFAGKIDIAIAKATLSGAYGNPGSATPAADDDGREDEGSGMIPAPGVVAALLAIAAVALVARRR